MCLFVSSGDGFCWLFLQVPVDLVIDHSVQVDVARSPNALHANMELEFGRNKCNDTECAPRTRRSN
jgi:hypothetical protein